MKRKLILSIFIVFMGFLFFNNVSAETHEPNRMYEYHCVYNGDDLDAYDVTFQLNKQTLMLVSMSCSDGESWDKCPALKPVKVALPDGLPQCPNPLTYNGKKLKFSHRYDVTELGNGSCAGYRDSVSCRASDTHACVWNETKYGDYCNSDNLIYVKCGDAVDIPHQVPEIISFAVNFLKILTPIILIAVSVISLLKALSASNEDEIKKAQKGLIRKVIAAVMVFFVTTIVQFVIMKVADSTIESSVNGKLETTNLPDCLNCFLNNNCGEVVYFKGDWNGTSTNFTVKRNK